MSVVSDGTADALFVDNAPFTDLGTGAFSIGLWFRLTAQGFQTDLLGVGLRGLSAHILLSENVSGNLVLYGPNFNDLPSSFSPVVGTWYWAVISGDGAGAGRALRLRIFDDTTSTTPDLDTSEAQAYDFSSASNGSDLTVATFFTGDGPDSEFRLVKVHDGVEWTDSQARTESQNVTLQTAGGTALLVANLLDIDADNEGINDVSGQGNDLTNSGMGNGTTDPSQLSEATDPQLDGAAETSTFDVSGQTDISGGVTVNVAGESEWSAETSDGDSLLIYVAGNQDLEAGFVSSATNQSLAVTNVDGTALLGFDADTPSAQVIAPVNGAALWGAVVEEAGQLLFVEARLDWGATLDGETGLGKTTDDVLRGGAGFVDNSAEYVSNVIRPTIKPY